jgi:hypothetical protein
MSHYGTAMRTRVLIFSQFSIFILSDVLEKEKMLVSPNREKKFFDDLPAILICIWANALSISEI